MTELEMSLTLGIMNEPVQNRVNVDPLLHAEIMYLKHVFLINQHQRQEIGTFNPDTWADLLPWHSLN
jgi:hypothetical protein